MTHSRLPARPDLDQLKRQAKDLLRSARAQDPAALARFRLLPTFASHRDAELARASLALHDAQSVIAREHGFASWKALREHVEEVTLEGRTERGHVTGDAEALAVQALGVAGDRSRGRAKVAHSGNSSANERR